MELSPSGSPSAAPLRRAFDESASLFALAPDWRRVGPAQRRAAHAWLGQERERFAALGRAPIRDRFLASRWLLRYAVAQALGDSLEAVELRTDALGRPTLARPAGLDVNLSHAGYAVVIGITRERRVGVDIEPADRDLIGARIAPLACTPGEARALARLRPADRNDRLVRLWTLKEAHGKATGAGLAARFTTFGFRLNGPRAVRVDEAPRWEGAGWTYHSWRTPGHWVSAALDGGRVASPRPRRRSRLQGVRR